MNNKLLNFLNLFLLLLLLVRPVVQVGNRACADLLGALQQSAQPLAPGVAGVREVALGRGEGLKEGDGVWEIFVNCLIFFFENNTG